MDIAGGQYLAQMAWLVLTEETALPRPQLDAEIKHAYGPIGVWPPLMAKVRDFRNLKIGDTSNGVSKLPRRY